MNLKRILAAGTAVLMLTAGSVTALAHHGGGGGHCGGRRAVTYQVCTYADCINTEQHTHGDGCYYYGHYEGDGHTHTASHTGCSGYYCH